MLKRVFELNRGAFNPQRAILALGALAIPLILVAALDAERYFVSVFFGVLFVGLCDPGGEYVDRVRSMGVVALIGALLTLWGFGIGGGAWGLVVLSVLVVTLLAGLTLKFGLHRFFAALLLNVWFLITLAVPVNFALEGTKSQAGSQTLAWLLGAAYWLVFVSILWLIRDEKSRPPPVAELPQDRTVTKLTRPTILFAVIRAVAIGASVAIAFGLHSPNADWMSLATLVAMKGTLEQSELAAIQRLIGTLLGAALAALVLLTIDNRHDLEGIIVILGVLAGAIRFVNNAFYVAAVAALVLIAIDLPHPTDLASEGRRVLFTLIGVAIAVVVMLVANQLQRRTTPRAA